MVPQCHGSNISAIVREAYYESDHGMAILLICRYLINCETQHHIYSKLCSLKYDPTETQEHFHFKSIIETPLKVVSLPFIFAKKAKSREDYLNASNLPEGGWGQNKEHAQIYSRKVV